MGDGLYSFNWYGSVGAGQHHRARVSEDGPLIDAIRAYLKDNPRYGFGLLFGGALKPRGWGKTRSWRVYTSLKLNRPRRGKKRLPDRIRDRMEIPALANHTWSEFISAALRDWAVRHGVELLHIQPGKPTQNALIERFNRTFCREVLDRYVFTGIPEVRHMTENWRHR